MNNDKYIFFDIDGTLYTPRLGVPESTQEAIEKLKKNGHHPVLCTGRTKCMLFPKVRALECEGLIAGVGSYGEWQGQKLFEKNISPEAALELIENFKKFGFNPFPEGQDHIFYDPEICTDPEGEIGRIFSLSDTSVVCPYTNGMDGITKVSAVFMTDSNKDAFKETLRGRYHAINHHDVLLETFPVTISKGQGILKLAEHLKINMDNTYAFGDSFNDLEMLETVKYGVCMENGNPKLLERIPLHARSMKRDGIYHSLKKFGLI